MMPAVVTDIKVFEDPASQFILHVLSDDSGQWFLATDVTKSAGWEGKLGKPSPTREISWKYKTTKRIQPEGVKGHAKPPSYEVLCLNIKGVWLCIDQIKKLVARPQTSAFMMWFETQVMPALQNKD